MSYTDKELQKAKEILEGCEFLSLSSKGCYSSRIAMWIHFCNTYCGGDDLITGRRLADYVEWLVSSGAADRIRQPGTHIQQVLRNQLQGVLSYWRIQTGGNADAEDPRLSPVFVDRWQQIAIRYPRPRQPRRTEPIYGAQKGPASSSQSIDARHQLPGTVTHISNINGDSPSASRNLAAATATMRPSLAPSSVPTPGYPSAGMAPHYSRRSPSRQHPYYADSGARNAYDMAYRQQQQQQQPFAPRLPPGVINRPAFPGTPPIAPRPRSPHAGSQVSDYRLAPTRTVAEGSVPMAAAEMSPQPSSPRTAPSTVAEEQIPQGQLPAEVPVWEGEGADAAGAPEGHLLNASEAIALSIQQLAAGTGVQIQARAHCMLGMAAWLPASARSALTLADLAIEEPFERASAAKSAGAASSSAAEADAEADAGADTDSRRGSVSNNSAADSESPADPPLKAISVALPAGASKDSRAVILRHANPLLCSWSALALCLFSRWLDADEATPDFSSAEWQTQRLFPDIAAGPEPAENDFARVFAAAAAEITHDKIDGAQAMRDSGFFFADALGLVRPTATGVKGLDAVRAVDASALLPSVLLALARANAGFSADAAEPIAAPGRANVQPPASLLKEVFPWLKTALIDAFRQNTNNDDVQAARRVLQVLRELRVVLLQDVAFLLEVPSVAAAVKDSPVFGHALFASPEFAAFRDEMRRAIGDSEISAAEELYAAALSWTDDRRQQMPEGAADRMRPTAPRLPSPAHTADRLSPEVGERKRLLELDSTPTLDGERGRSAAADELSASPKRARHVYSRTATPQGGRIFSEAAGPLAPGVAGVTPEPAAAAAAASTAAATVGLAKTIGELRAENDDLKAYVRRLEWSLNQHKAEMRTWMGRMDMAFRHLTGPRGASPMPEAAAPHHAERMGAAHRPLLPTTPSGKFPTTSSQQQQQQQNPYAGGGYRDMAPHSRGQAALPSASREAAYERQIAMYPTGHSPNHPPRAQPTPGEYRHGGHPLASPRNPAYAARRAPGAEYADHSYGGHYAGGPPRQPATTPGYGFSEHDVYQRRPEAPYAGAQRGRY